MRSAHKQWIVYVVWWSLLNVWVSVIWLASSGEPLRAVARDGSLIVFCIVAVWLTLGGLSDELDRHGLRPQDDRGLRRKLNSLHLVAGITTVVAVVFYAQFIVSGPDLSDQERTVTSIVAGVFGLVYAREAIITSHKARQA
jgi:hypothetical protein